MAKTMLITGASSGIGKEAAKVFAAHGWNVVATMRSPEKEQDLVLRQQTFATSLPIPPEAPIVFAMDDLSANWIERSFYWFQNLYMPKRSCDHAPSH